MELAGEMRESDFELSLKDIVNDRTASPSRAITERDRVEVDKGGSFHFGTEKQSKGKKGSTKQKKKKKKKNAVIKPCVVPRSYSVDKGTVLIKMFSPSNLRSWKKTLKSSSSLKEGSVGSSSSRGSSRTTSRSSSCSSSSSGYSSNSTTRLRMQSITSTFFLDCLTCLTSSCAGGTHKSRQRSRRECMF